MSVPANVFSAPWLEGNFLIPADRGTRVELLQKLEKYAFTGIMFLPEHERVRLVLQARIAAIRAFDIALSAR